MPEIDRERLSTKLDSIPEPDREPYLQALKSKGYTWKSNDGPAPAQDTGEALLTNKPTQGLKQKIVRGLPSTAGMIAGASEGAPIGAALGTAVMPGPGTAVGGFLGAVGGAALGAGAGEAARQGVSNITAAAFPQEKFPIQRPGKLMAAVGGAAKEGAESESMGRIASPVISKVAGKAYSLLAQKLGGLSDYAVSAAEKNAPKVLKYARMGIEGAAEAAAEMAKKFGGAIKDFERELSKRYVEDVLDNGIKKVGESTVMDFQSKIAPTIEAIQNEFVFDPAEQKVFDKVVSKWEEGVSKAPPSLGGEAPRPDQYTVGQAYRFQKFLNKAIEGAKGKRTLYAALIDLKGSVVDSFEPVVPELQAGNNIYREGRNVVKGMSKVEKADDAARAINTALKNRGKTRDALMEFIKRSPACKEILDDFIAAQAGKEFASWTVQSPKTGFMALHTAAPVAAVAGPAAAHHPLVAIPALAAYYSATSPRLYGLGYAAAPYLGKNLPGLLSPSLKALADARDQ